jgi:hypothetical protein
MSGWVVLVMVLALLGAGLGVYLWVTWDVRRSNKKAE